MNVIVVEPHREPYLAEINSGLKSLQAMVGGYIEVLHPFTDPVSIVCNEEGKLNGLALNRGLCDENGHLHDIIAGTFLIVGLGDENFESIPPELTEKYLNYFKHPEQFINLNGTIVAVPEKASMRDQLRAAQEQVSLQKSEQSANTKMKQYEQEPEL